MITTALVVLLGTCLLAIPAAAAVEPDHLPEKAKVVSTKFEAYQKTAKPADVEAKRKQVIKYLGGILKEEAAKANLDGALAVKALIEQLGDRSQAKPATTTKQKPATNSKSKAKTEGLPIEQFSINSDAKRRLEYSFYVAKDGSLATINCEIAGAADDTGDLGLAYELVDPSGKVAKRGKLNSAETEQVVHKTRRGGDWKIVLLDADTELDGVHPGNNGSVSVKVTRTHTTLASTRP